MRIAPSISAHYYALRRPSVASTPVTCLTGHVVPDQSLQEPELGAEVFRL